MGTIHTMPQDTIMSDLRIARQQLDRVFDDGEMPLNPPGMTLKEWRLERAALAHAVLQRLLTSFGVIADPTIQESSDRARLEETRDTVQQLGRNLELYLE